MTRSCPPSLRFIRSVGDPRFFIETRRLLFHSALVSKSVLGRGLGTLLNGTAVVGKPDVAGQPTASPSETPLSPGVGSLLLGADPATPVERKPTPSISVGQPARAPSTVPRRTLLLVADLLLVTEAVLVVRKSSGPLSPGETILCVLAIATAAWLGCQAFWPTPPTDGAN